MSKYCFVKKRERERHKGNALKCKEKGQNEIENSNETGVSSVEVPGPS